MHYCNQSSSLMQPEARVRAKMPPEEHEICVINLRPNPPDRTQDGWDHRKKTVNSHMLPLRQIGTSGMKHSPGRPATPQRPSSPMAPNGRGQRDNGSSASGHLLSRENSGKDPISGFRVQGSGSRAAPPVQPPDPRPPDPPFPRAAWA